MSINFHYDPTEADDNSKVRGIIGDTNMLDPQLADETIDAILVSKGSVTFAAIECCRRLILKYSRQPDVRFGPSSVSGSQIASQYREALKELLRGASTGAGIYVGGISKADKQTSEASSDRVEPAFTKNMFEYSGGDDSPLADFDD